MRFGTPPGAHRVRRARRVSALALRKAGLALGWGFQLQQPLVVAAIALLLFALGLSLSGVWYPNVGIGARGNAWMQKHGVAGDFATGVLAVVLATPCIGPFMGAALAYASPARRPAACWCSSRWASGLHCRSC